MAKKVSNKQRLIDGMIELFTQMSDNNNIIDNNEKDRERYQPSTDKDFNTDLKRTLEYNFINPVEKSFTDKRGVTGSPIDRAKDWMEKSADYAASTASLYQNPVQGDSKVTEEAVAKACQTADKAKAKYDALVEWAEICQSVYFHFNGYYFDQQQEEKKAAVDISDYLTRYGNAG